MMINDDDDVDDDDEQTDCGKTCVTRSWLD